MQRRATSRCLGKDSEKLADCKAGFCPTAFASPTTLRSGCSLQSLLAFVISLSFYFFLDLSLMMVGSKLLSGTMKHSPACDSLFRMTKSMKSKKSQVMVTSNILLALSLKQRTMA